MSTDFKSILSRPADAAKPPVAVPPGTWEAVIIGQPTFAEKGKNKTPCATFQVKLISPQEDVDAEQLAAFCGDDPMAFQKKNLKLDFWLSEDALYRIGQFAENTLGLSIAGVPYDQLFSQLANIAFLAVVTNTPSGKNDGQFFSNIDQTARLAA